MMNTPFRCWRRREDCEPLHAIEGIPEGTTADEFEHPDFNPRSFVCCGINHSESRGYQQDAYRLCFKNAHVDEISDNDKQDLTHIMAVIAQALAIGASRELETGAVTVPTMQGDPIAALAATPEGRAEPATTETP